MFLKNLGLAKILLLNILLVVFVVIIILGAFWIYDEYATSHKEAEGMRLEYIESQKTMIEEEVSQIIDYVEYIRFHHKGTEEQIQSEVLGWINEFRYGENGYIFVNTFEGITLAHYKKENIGKNRIDLTDSNGVRINEELINASKNPDGGYVDYVGTIKPDTNEPAPKIGYAQSIDDWQWSIGTGVYVDDIEVIIAEKRVTLQKEVRTQVLQIAVVLSAVIVLAILFAIFFSRKIKRESTVITSFFKEAVADNKQVDTSELSIQEFKIIGDHANSMLLAKDEIERARRHVEEELREQREHLEELVKERTTELEEMSRHKSEFLANMSHELRTPLTSILGYTKLILDGLQGDINEEQRKGLGIVHKSSKHLLQLINDLLDLARIEAGKTVLSYETFTISELLSEVIPVLDGLAKEKGLAFTYSVAPDIDSLYADKGKTRQVLINILSNAVKFTSEGSVKLNIAETDNDFIFSVTDTGRGMKNEDLEAIFDSFKQAGQAHKTDYEGTGLGLTISKQFIEMQGGRIWAESELGKGSTFTFTLPKEKMPDP